MGRLLKNDHLNYWVCGLIFSVAFAVVAFIVSTVIGLLGLIAGGIAAFIVYIAVMPYITGRLVDYISDRWMD